jgi:hypothetical protein
MAPTITITLITMPKMAPPLGPLLPFLPGAATGAPRQGQTATTCCRRNIHSNKRPGLLRPHAPKGVPTDQCNAQANHTTTPHAGKAHMGDPAQHSDRNYTREPRTHNSGCRHDAARAARLVSVCNGGDVGVDGIDDSGSLRKGRRRPHPPPHTTEDAAAKHGDIWPYPHPYPPPTGDWWTPTHLGADG